MADNIAITVGNGGKTVATDDVGGVQYQKVKLDLGGDGVSVPVETAVPVTGTITAVTAITNVVHVDDNAGSLTVDNAGLTKLAAAIDTEVQCDIVGSLPAGTNNIGDMDIVTMPLGGYAAAASLVSGATSDMTDTTSTQVIAAAGASTKNYITTIMVSNSHATVGTFVNITDGSGGTVLWTGYAAALGGGYVVNLNVPIVGSANTALHAVCVTTGANVRVCAAGYKAA